jgi:IS5 family transposase
VIGLRSMTTSEYEKLFTDFGIVKEDSIFFAFRNLILPLVRDGDFASLYNLDKGRDSISPALLSLALVLQSLLDYSDRKMARAIRADLEVKYALGLPVLYPGFHYSLLSIHRKRLIEGGQGKDIFDQVLSLAQEKGLLSKGEDQILDSTHIIADISLPTASGLVRQAMTNLLMTIEKHDPSLAEKMAGNSDTLKYLDKIRKVKPTSGIPREKKEYKMTPDEKKALFAQVVREGRALARVCKEEGIEDESCKEALALLIEILESIAKGDDDNITPTPPKSRKCKIGSVHDRDARYAKKTRETGYFGYKAHTAMSAKSRFITHTETTPMDVGDTTMAPALVDGVLSHGLAPSKALGDTHYGSGKFRALAKCRGIEVSAPLFPKAQLASWAKQGFIYDPLAETMTCPAGKVTTSKWYNARGEVITYKFPPKMCKCCPRAKDCMGEKSYVSASLSVYHEELKAAAAYNETEAFQLDKAIRAWIEAKFAEAKRFHGMARAIYRSLKKVDLQVLLTAIALNIKRMFTLLKEAKASALREPQAA